MLILCLLLCITLPARADAADDFEAANEQFRRQDYAGAYRIYSDLIGQGFNDPVLHYNAGCALAEMGENGRAAAMFERALKLDPRMDKARRNLQRVRPSPPAAATPFILLPAEWIFTRYTASEFFAVMVFCYWIFAIAAVAWILSSGRLKTIAASGSIVMLIAAFVAFGFFVVKRDRERWLEAVALSDNTVTRSGPSEKHIQQDILSGGVKIRCLEPPREGWIKVQLPNGRVGYVQESAVEVL